MATHSSVLAWRIPGTVEPGGPPSMGSHRVGQDWSDLAAAAEAVLSYLGTVIFPGSSAGKESTCNAGKPSSIPGSGRAAGERINYPLQYSWASLVAHMVKNLLAMWETWVQSLGWEDPLEDGTPNHSSILAWRIPLNREAWWATVCSVPNSGTWLKWLSTQASVQFSSVAQSCPTLCDPMNRSTPGLPVHHPNPGVHLIHLFDLCKRHTLLLSLTALVSNVWICSLVF